MAKMYFKIYRRAVVSVLLFSGFAQLAGCASPPPNPQLNASAILAHAIAEDPVVSHETQELTPDQLREISEDEPDSAYQLGSNDIISVSVYKHPELSVPAVTDLQGGGFGALITGDGTVSLPLIGTVHIGGMTIDEAQAAVQEDYASYIHDPRVALGLIQAQSLRYYLLGAFTAPGIKYPVHNLTLLEALALGGSVDLPHADLYQAFVAQGSTKLPIDLHGLLVNGDLTQNVRLASGDTIVVPSTDTENAFVFGAVGKPGAIPFQGGALSLLQALASSGLDLPSYTDARLSQVRVIRAHGQNAEFYVVDGAKILNGQAASFALEPGDIVFVPPTAVASWNQVLKQLLPSLETVSASLSPFVDIAYLNRN